MSTLAAIKLGVFEFGSPEFVFGQAAAIRMCRPHILYHAAIKVRV